MGVGDHEYVASLRNIGKVEDAVALNPGLGELLLRVSKQECDLAVIDSVAVFGEERARDLVETADWNGDVDAFCLLTGLDFDDGGVFWAKGVAGVNG